MNDPFEERLRSLRPAALPEQVKARLAKPPFSRSRGMRRLLSFAVPLAAAACLALALVWPATESAPMLVRTHSQEVIGVLPVSFITDSENRPWEFVEVSWVEESTLVSSGSPVAMQVRDVRRAVGPTPVYFD